LILTSKFFLLVAEITGTASPMSRSFQKIRARFSTLCHFGSAYCKRRTRFSNRATQSGRSGNDRQPVSVGFRAASPL